MVFLTGQEEIESLLKLLEQRSQLLPADAMRVLVCPVFSALPPEQQMRVFLPTAPNCRKIILATNIAESSITINGIKYVVDTGMVKQKLYNAQTGLECLKVVPVSKAAAKQRSGRAGRECAGECYRLYTEADYHALRECNMPEIQRTNLASVILQLKVIGIDDLVDFEFMSRPKEMSLVKALELLYTLGALDRSGSVTVPLGKQMAELPLEPMMAKLVLSAPKMDCLDEILSIVSLLSIDSVFFTPPSKRQLVEQVKQRFASLEGDHLSLLNVWRQYKEAKGARAWCMDHFINTRSMKLAIEVREQLVGYCTAMKLVITSCGRNLESVLRCLVCGLFMQAARLQPDGRTYRTLVSNQEVYIHPSSVLLDKKRPAVIYTELVMTSKQYIRTLTAIDTAWLAELAPQMYSRQS